MVIPLVLLRAAGRQSPLTGAAMDLSSGDISSMIFKRAVRNGRGDYSLDRQALVVFMELDGEATLGAIAKKAGLSMVSLREAISRLLQLGLVEKIKKQMVLVDDDFMSYLGDQLSLSIGPIAQVLIEDEIQSLGYDLSQLPIHCATELVNKLALTIRRKEKRSDFLKNMAHKIRQKGYLQF